MDTVGYRNLEIGTLETTITENYVVCGRSFIDAVRDNLTIMPTCYYSDEYEQEYISPYLSFDLLEFALYQDKPTPEWYGKKDWY